MVSRPEAGEPSQKGGRLPERSWELNYPSNLSRQRHASCWPPAGLRSARYPLLILSCRETNPSYYPFLPVPCDFSQLGESHICHLCRRWLTHYVFFSLWALAMVIIRLWPVWPSEPSVLSWLCAQENCTVY